MFAVFRSVGSDHCDFVIIMASCSEREERAEK
jgi:hypothetical protein